MSGTKRYLERLGSMSDTTAPVERPPGSSIMGSAHAFPGQLQPDAIVLVQLLYEELCSNSDWPVFDYVERRLKPLGVDAAATIAGMPTVGQPKYGPVWFQTMGPIPRPESVVGATLAGLAQLPEAECTVDACLRVIRGLADHWQSQPLSPRQPASLAVRWVDIAQLVRSNDGDPLVTQVNAVIRLLEHEPPTWGGTNLGSEPSDRRWTVPRTVAAFEHVQSLPQYFDQVVDLLTPARVASAADPQIDQSRRVDLFPRLNRGSNQDPYPKDMPTPAPAMELEVLRAVAGLEAENPPGRYSSVDKVAAAVGIDREAAIRIVLALIEAHRLKGTPLRGDGRITSISGIGLLPAGRDAVRMQSRTPTEPDDASGKGLDRSMAQTVFIVHGHDGAMKAEVARTVQLLTGRNPVILHEKPNRGRTLIEKFEGHAAEAGFVVVLATADDLGRARTAEANRPRARQNVVFEWGFFVGALGRDKVAVLYEDGVELPSDIVGVAYIPLRGGGEWKHELAREMRSSGVDADTNEL